MIARILFVLPVCCALILTGSVSAQESTPTGAGGCTVEPRTLEEIDSVMATPVVEMPVNETPAGTRVDDATLIEIQQVIIEADTCAAQGDYLRLAALYSDHALQSGVLAGEELPIEAGVPETTPAAPIDPDVAPPFVSLAILIPDGRAIAYVEQGSTVSVVVLVEVDGRWLIDSDEVVVEEIVEDGLGTPAVDSLPIQVLQAIVDLVSESTGADVQSITIISSEPEEWSDTFLGCPIEGSFAAQVITPGYRVTVEFEGEQFEVHTDLEGRAVSC